MNEKDKIYTSDDICTFLLTKVADLYAITDTLYEKLKENNIDVGDFQEKYTENRKNIADEILNDLKEFIDKKDL